MQIKKTNKQTVRKCLRQLTITSGLCPFNIGWSKAGCWWDTTQSITSPSGLWWQRKEVHRVTVKSRGEKKGHEKLEALAHLNCLDRGLVDLLKTSSYDVHLVNLFLRLKSLIGNWGVAHFWGTNRTKQRNNKKEMYKCGNDRGAQTKAKIHAWEICLPCFYWQIRVSLFTLALSSCSCRNKTKVCVPRLWFFQGKHVFHQIYPTHGEYSKKG